MYGTTFGSILRCVKQKVPPTKGLVNYSESAMYITKSTGYSFFKIDDFQNE